MTSASRNSPWIIILGVILIATTGLSVHFQVRASRAEKARQVLQEEKEQLERQVAAFKRALDQAGRQNRPAFFRESAEEPVVMAEEEGTSAPAEAKATVAPVQTAAVVPDQAQPRPPEERRNWMEDLQQNDPERYKEMMERREQSRQAAQYDIAKKSAHFLQRDTASMSEKELEEYHRMINLLTASFELTDKLQSDLPREDRRAIGFELRDNLRELSPLLEAERERELVKIGEGLGYKGEAAGDFAAYINEIIEITSVNSLFRNTMRGGGGWGGGPPPPDGAGR